MSRYALGLWFSGIALIGAIEFHRAAFDGAAAFRLTPIAWMWLAGTLVTACVGVTSLLRAWRRRD